MRLRDAAFLTFESSDQFFLGYSLIEAVYSIEHAC
jgi:hypothetical protein